MPRSRAAYLADVAAWNASYGRTPRHQLTLETGGLPLRPATSKPCMGNVTTAECSRNPPTASPSTPNPPVRSTKFHSDPSARSGWDVTSPNRGAFTASIYHVLTPKVKPQDFYPRDVDLWLPPVPTCAAAPRQTLCLRGPGTQ
ncbi:hypothetical protein DFH09DRAFT_1098785 [Mycena vulgaris]|nr:hypothetical protein DFH09DRAFT_1098785 [Mycena vulgaris]